MMNEVEPLNTTEKIDRIYKVLEEGDKKEIKKLKLPRRAKVGKGKMKRGFCGILFLNENRTLRGEKSKLEGGTYKTKDGSYHVTDGSELLFWEGKFPVLFQRHDKLNPTNILLKEPKKNEIYGQDLVYLRMKNDAIKNKSKRKVNWLMIIIVLAAGYFLLKAFFPSLFGG